VPGAESQHKKRSRTFGDAAWMVERCADERWAHFIRLLREGRLLPLVGAGVSIPVLPGGEKLARQLRGCIEQYRDGFGIPEEMLGLGKLAEIAIRLRGAAQVCEELGIASWATEKSPTRAHRYLVMLAADGYIDEIISTNYDGCIERAWRELGPGERGELAVISDASKLHCRRRGVGLRLYKINGCAKELNKIQQGRREDEHGGREINSCAKEWNKAPDKSDQKNNQLERAAESILLTDTQLQGVSNSAERRWVRDLLRNHARSHTLVLSGFGSDEPQVWHVVRLILEELRDLRESVANSDSESEPRELEPHLWAVLYGTQIPFHIFTALHDDWLLRHPRDPTDQEGSFNGRLDNLFSACDRRFFSCCCGSGLDAGDFWCRVWREGLLENLADHRGAVAAAFVRRVAGRRGRPERAEDSILFQVWGDIVVEVQGELPLSEPTSWSSGGSGSGQGAEEESSGQGAPGVSWVGGRYATTREEPDYWVAVVLLALGGAAERLQQEWEVEEPWVGLRPVGEGRARLRDSRGEAGELVGGVEARLRGETVELRIPADLAHGWGGDGWMGKGGQSEIVAGLRQDIRRWLRHGNWIDAARREESERRARYKQRRVEDESVASE
jgi:hypothetical protein